MPPATENERWFHVLNPRDLHVLLPPDVSVACIEQTYLNEPGDGLERRVRSWTEEDTTTYYYSEKRWTGVLGQRDECEREITVSEYHDLRREQIDGTKTVRKVRYFFFHNGYVFEVDHMIYPAEGLVKVEVEVAVIDLDTPIDFPPGWRVTEVTGNLRYSMRNIAAGSFGFE